MYKVENDWSAYYVLSVVTDIRYTRRRGREKNLHTALWILASFLDTAPFPDRELRTRISLIFITELTSAVKWCFFTIIFNVQQQPAFICKI